ncbi:MAG: type II toxin-antitoxin system VapC family toxin [Candidatus Nanopelagicales bacterium]
MTAYYLDASAALKLVVHEEGSAALRAWTQAHTPRFVASELMRVEVLRACRRHSSKALARARDVVDSVTLASLTTDVCIDAAGIDPAIIRTLDALHIATALAFGDDLEGVVTYDSRMADACRVYGLRVIAPQ